MAQQLSIDVINEPSGLRVVLKGAGDIAGADAMQRRFLGVVAQNPKRVIIDLSGLTLISSIAMGVLVQLGHGVRQHGGDVVLAGADGIVLDALRRAQLDRMFKVVRSVEAAN